MADVFHQFLISALHRAIVVANDALLQDTGHNLSTTPQSPTTLTKSTRLSTCLKQPPIRIPTYITQSLLAITMPAPTQCDQPHVVFEHQRSGPTNTSNHWLEDLGEIDSQKASWLVSSRRSHMFSHSNQSVFKQEVGSLASPFTLHAPLPSTALLPPSVGYRPSTTEGSCSSSTSSTLLPTMKSPSSIMLSTTADHPTNSLLLQNLDDRITSLERSVCSNFICCGGYLADFHALIDHFEEKHVSVVTPTGKKLYPPQGSKQPSRSRQASVSSSSPLQGRRPEPPKINTNVSSPSPSTVTLGSTTSTPSCSRSSSVVSSPPMPITPLSPLRNFVSHDQPPLVEYNPYLGLAVTIAHPQPLPELHSPFSIDVISAFGPEYDFSRDYACYETAFAEKCKRDSEAQQRSFQEPLDCERLYDDWDVREPSVQPEMLERPLQKKNKTLMSGREATEVVEPSPSISSDGGKVAKPKPKTAIHTPLGAAPSPGRKREKAYKCPHYGCTKAYLNPNGLKYHLEKGTCKFEDPKAQDTSSEPTSAVSSHPASPISKDDSSSTSSKSANYVEPHNYSAVTPSRYPSTQTTPEPSESASRSLSCPYPGTPSSTGSSSSPYACPSRQSRNPTLSPVQACAGLNSLPLHGDFPDAGLSLEDSPGIRLPPASSLLGSAVSPSVLTQEQVLATIQPGVVPEPSRRPSTNNSVDDPVTQDKLAQGSRFATVYSHHLHVHPMCREQVVYDNAPSSSSL